MSTNTIRVNLAWLTFHELDADILLPKLQGYLRTQGYACEVTTWQGFLQDPLCLCKEDEDGIVEELVQHFVEASL